MRRGVGAALLLVACASPVGADRPGCAAEWQEAEAVAAMALGTDEQPLRIECMHQIANRRVRVGFVLPAGPSCHVLSRVELVESADAISITLFGAVDDDPNAGACPDEARRAVTEIDVAAPVDDRALLDGSGS